MARVEVKKLEWARRVKKLNLAPILPPKGIKLLWMLAKNVEAIEELEYRKRNAPLDPNSAYELIYNATGDEKQAMEAKVQMMLAAMPEPDKTSIPTS